MTDWDDLRYFLAVARSGNVTAAASVLGVNHSTVSRRISALEKKHGVRLFERLLSGYTMTAAAENIYDLALQIEADNQRVERLLFGQDSRLQGRLNVTMPHDLATRSIIPELNSFITDYPGIDLRLLVSPGLKDLAAREADIAVRLTPSPPDYLVGQQVADLRHGIYRSRSYQTRRRADSPSAREPGPQLVLWGQEPSLPDWASAPFPDAEVALRVDDLASMYAAVKAGIGIARMPCYLPDALADPAVERLDLPLQPSNWGVWVLSHVDLRQTERVRTCRNFLIRILSEQRDLFEGKRSEHRCVAAG